MSATAFSSVAAQILAVLQAAPPLGSGNVTDVDEPPSQDWPDAVVLVLDSSDPNPRLSNHCTWTTAFTVRCFGRATADAKARDVADALLQASYERLFSSVQPFTGILPGRVTFETDEADTDLACYTFRFTVPHQAMTASLLPRT